MGCVRLLSHMPCRPSALKRPPPPLSWPRRSVATLTPPRLSRAGPRAQGQRARPLPRAPPRRCRRARLARRRARGRGHVGGAGRAPRRPLRAPLCILPLPLFGGGNGQPEGARLRLRPQGLPLRPRAGSIDDARARVRRHCAARPLRAGRLQCVRVRVRANGKRQGEASPPASCHHLLSPRPLEVCPFAPSVSRAARSERAFPLLNLLLTPPPPSSCRADAHDDGAAAGGRRRPRRAQRRRCGAARPGRPLLRGEQAWGGA